jgi:hypothetical protein
MDGAKVRAMNRRHRDSDRPSVEYRNVQAHGGISADEAAVIDVMQTTHVCTRERDMAVLALSYEQIALYLEALYIPMEPEQYMHQVRSYWRYIDDNPSIYAPDGTPRWRRHMQMETK